TAPRGLEPLLVAELTTLGAQNPSAVPGGVAFSGDWRVCYAANLWSRLASRVLWRVAEFNYTDENDLHEAARKVDWMRYFTVERTLRVNVSAQKSPLTSLDFATLRIKDAVCDRFRETAGSRPNIDRANPDVRVHAFLESARGAFYLDTSGEPLFKRGWRAGAGDAPLRENLAAGIVMLSGWKPEEPLLDPMCGGGTILVEAAAMARGRAPGASRRFGFEKLKVFENAVWESVKKESLKPRDPPRNLQIFGSDHDPRVLGDARRNVAAAGVDRWVKLEQTDILDRAAPAPAGAATSSPPTCGCPSSCACNRRAACRCSTARWSAGCSKSPSSPAATGARGGGAGKTGKCTPSCTFAGARSDDIEVLDTLGEVLVLRFLAVQLDVEAHFVGRVGETQRVFVADAAGLVEVEQRLVEGLHAEFPRLLHDFLDAVDLALEDEVRDQRRIQQHFHRRGPALAFLERDQALRDHAFQVERQV